MRIKFMSRSEALPVLKAVDPADLLQEVIDRGVRVMPPENLMSKKATCPHCGAVGPIGKDFGVRVLGGTVRAQSWCRDCRKNPKRSTGRGAKAPQNKEDMMELLRKSMIAAGVKKSNLAKLAKAMGAL